MERHHGGRGAEWSGVWDPQRIMVPNKINKKQTGFSLPYLFVFPALALSILALALELCSQPLSSTTSLTSFTRRIKHHDTQERKDAEMIILNLAIGSFSLFLVIAKCFVVATRLLNEIQLVLSLSLFVVAKKCLFSLSIYVYY